MVSSKKIKDDPEKGGENQVTAPDGGWGWVVVVGAVVLNFLIGGAVNTFGVIYLSLLDIYQQSAGKTAWVGSMANAMGLLLGPFSSAMSSRFSCRTMVLVGGALTSAGWLTTGFMPKLEYMFITYGLLAGIGKSMAFTPSIVMVGQWFDKRRSLANGLSVAGAGVGTFAFAPLLEYLLETYGFTGTMLIMGGVMLHICVCGSLFLPVPDQAKLKAKTLAMEEKKFCVANGDPAFHTMSNGKPCADNNRSNLKDKQTPAKERKPIKEFLDYTLLKNAQFLCFGFSVMFATLGHSPASVMLPSLAKEHDVDSEKAAFLLSITGITDIIGRLTFGVLCDIKYFKQNRKYLYVCSICISGIANVTCGFAYRYWHFATYSVIFGLFAGSYNALTPVILVDLLGADKLSSSFGLALLFQGVGFLLGPPMAGLMRDGFGDYQSAFYFAGVAMILSSFIINLTTLCNKCANPTRKGSITGTHNPVFSEHGEDDTPISVIYLHKTDNGDCISDAYPK